ncbi:MAG TPA: hypothetical protein PKA64_13455 [Myxococcota bacterium]|nr:hypothetical protein [Myxococcota bacterium]
MTTKGDKTYIAALQEERARLEAVGKSDRVKQVDAELKRVGGSAGPRRPGSASNDDQIEG